LKNLFVMGRQKATTRRFFWERIRRSEETFMTLKKVFAGGLAALVLSAGAASAAPLSNPITTTDLPTLVETVQGMHRDCRWRRGGWFWVDRYGNLRACRPHSPGRGWVWHHDGPRHGWYHPHRRSWHHRHW
jgi:hypothetical protein